MTFSEILEHLKNGECVRRNAWKPNLIAVKQINADIPNNVISNMQSLPQSAKNVLKSHVSLGYRNQCLIIEINDDGAIATNYVPNWNDIFADDWMVAENEF